MYFAYSANKYLIEAEHSIGTSRKTHANLPNGLQNSFDLMLWLSLAIKCQRKLVFIVLTTPAHIFRLTREYLSEREPEKPSVQNNEHLTNPRDQIQNRTNSLLWHTTPQGHRHTHSTSARNSIQFTMEHLSTCLNENLLHQAELPRTMFSTVISHSLLAPLLRPAPAGGQGHLQPRGGHLQSVVVGDGQGGEQRVRHVLRLPVPNLRRVSRAQAGGAGRWEQHPPLGPADTPSAKATAGALNTDQHTPEAARRRGSLV